LIDMKPGLVDIFKDVDVERCLEAMKRLDQRTGCGVRLGGALRGSPEIHTRHDHEDESFPNLVIKKDMGRWKCCTSIYIDGEQSYAPGWGDTAFEALLSGVRQMPLQTTPMTTDLYYWLKEEEEEER